MDLLIDKFTPCLESEKTGEIFSTVYSRVGKTELNRLKNWQFNWVDDDLNETEIYKLCIKDDTIIQGLIALTDFKRDKAIYVNIAESAPHNFGKQKEYRGVGGHLFAIAADVSMKKGYGGYFFMDAKNLDLVKHYHEILGAILLGHPHQYRMIVTEENAQTLLEKYTLEEV